jgi:hypothetical protein
MMTDDQVTEFKRDAQPFEYTEELGTIKGFRNRDGKVLITESSLSSYVRGKAGPTARDEL